MQWSAFLATSGIARLDAADDNADVRRAKRQALAEIKVGALHEALSRDTLRMVRNLPLTADQRLDAVATIAALQTFIDRGTNKRMYRCKLAGRQQNPNEPLEDFLVAIKDLAVRCKYTATADNNAAMEDHLFDALVTNINDQEVTEKLLQLDEAKTFDNAVKVAQSILTARQDATTVTGSTPRMMKEMGIRRKNLRGSKPPPPAPRLADGSRSGLRPLGFFQGNLAFGSARCHADIYVTDGLHQPLLSRAACFALGILRSNVLPGGRGKDSPQ
jgi:hypothetical protein